MFKISIAKRKSSFILLVLYMVLYNLIIRKYNFVMKNSQMILNVILDLNLSIMQYLCYFINIQSTTLLNLLLDLIIKITNIKLNENTVASVGNINALKGTNVYGSIVTINRRKILCTKQKYMKVISNYRRAWLLTQTLIKTNSRGLYCQANYHLHNYSLYNNNHDNNNCYY